MTLDKKLEDWEKVKKIFDMIKRTGGEEKKEIIMKFSEEAKKYTQKYNTKFNYFMRPR